VDTCTMARSAFVKSAGTFGGCDYPWLIRMMWVRMSQKWPEKFMGKIQRGSSDLKSSKKKKVFTSRASSSLERSSMTAKRK
jgi:hypothetical protein